MKTDITIPIGDIESIEDESQLEDLLSRPSEADVACVRRLDSDVLIIGGGGKMGPSLARLVRRAMDAGRVERRVIAVSAEWLPGTRSALDACGVETIACDLLAPGAVERLPACSNLLYLAGRKFGTAGRADLTWAINTLLPGHVMRVLQCSRVVAFSSGNVYGSVPVAGGGSRECDTPVPVGEYAQSCLGRELVFEYFSRERAIACLLFRLNYAVDLRYGVVVDIARRVFTGAPVDVSVGYVNAIWQGDAISYALRALDLAAAPPRVLNVTGAELVNVRDLATWFGETFGRPPRFEGREEPAALLSDASQCHAVLGRPQVDLDRLRRWVAAWILGGGKELGKPTHYEVTDGRF